MASPQDRETVRGGVRGRETADGAGAQASETRQTEAADTEIGMVLPEDEGGEAGAPPDPRIAMRAGQRTQRPQRPEPGTRKDYPQLDEDQEALARRIEAAMPPESPIVQEDPLLGLTVANRFVIEAKIGAGGMGAVYKATQLGMDRNVAIKVLLGEYAANPMLIKRFHMEALAVSKLIHPNAIRIFDFGQTERGMLFIAMEYLSGRALEHELRAARTLPVKRTLHIMKQVCRALEEAHDKGIVHRDLKPDNIFLIKVSDDPDFVKVLDFGVAKLKAEEKKHGTLTQAGLVFGTPKYMSPEQSRSAVTDARSDIYALGVILYEMMAGKAPFEAENPLSILIKHVQEEPKAFAVVRPDLVIPAAVEAIVRRCLEKEPNHRYDHVRDLAEALEAAERSLSATFDKVVMRADAAALGIDLSREEAFTAPDTRGRLLPEQGQETEPMSPEESAALLRAVRRRRRRKVLAVAAALLVLAAGGGALGVYLNLPAAPPAFQRLLAAPVVGIGEVPSLQPDVVRLTLASSPPGATVYRGEEPLGRVPLQIERLRQDAIEAYTFRLDGYEPRTEPLNYRKDGTFLAELAAVRPQVVVKEIEVVKEVPGKPIVRLVEPKPGEKAPPSVFRGGKVGDVKKLR